MRSRGVLVTLLVAVGLALLVSSWSGRRRVLRASDTVALGLGETLVQSIGRSLADAPPSMRHANLQEILDALEPQGLRFIGLATHDGRAVDSAGTPEGEWPPRRPQQPRGLERVGSQGRVRMQRPAGPPAPPPGVIPLRDPPPRADPPPLPGDRLDAWRRPRFDPHADTRLMVVIEFEPLLASALEREATLTLIAGAAGALALVATSILLWRVTARQVRDERRFGEQRRLAALGEMSAVLAHEIRNPLASLKGHAQLLAEKLQPGGGERRSADRVVDEAVRLERLAAGLLDFVRTGRAHAEPVAPADLVKESADEAAPGRVDIDARRAPASWPLDAPRMRQVVRNLVDNAAQVSPPGARIGARVAEHDGRLVIEVTDSGPGIPPEDRERVFEPFHSTRVTGTGLGLAVCRRIVEAHRGTIRALASPSGGSVFRVEIPREQER